MDGLTFSQAFQARELHEAGIWSGRIAPLLGVEERHVRDALNGDDTVASEQPPEVTPRPAAPPARSPDVRDPNAWPPPAGAATEWTTVWMRTSRTDGTEVRVRAVLLWGNRVLINDENDVWCTWCGGVFHTAESLCHPDNHCPTGIIRRGGILSFDVDADLQAPHTRRDIVPRWSW